MTANKQLPNWEEPEWLYVMPPIPLACAVPVRTTQDSWIVVGEIEARDDNIGRVLILKPESECSPTSSDD